MFGLWVAFFPPLRGLIKPLFEAASLPAVRCQRGGIMGKREMSVWALGTFHQSFSPFPPAPGKNHGQSWSDCVHLFIPSITIFLADPHTGHDSPTVLLSIGFMVTLAGHF